MNKAIVDALDLLKRMRASIQLLCPTEPFDHEFFKVRSALVTHDLSITSSGDDAVRAIKAHMAAAFDEALRIKDLVRIAATPDEIQLAMVDAAILHLQTAQMLLVKLAGRRRQGAEGGGAGSRRAD